MTESVLRSSLGIVVAVAMATAAAAQAPRPAGTAPARPASAANGPRTADGHPDFTGTYDLATLTPLERPANAGGRATLTEQEVQQMLRQEQARRARGALPSNPNRSAPPVGGNQAGANTAGGAVGGYNSFWIDRGDSVMKVNGEYRTSILVDPPDGRVPPTTAEARQRNQARLAQPTSDTAENAGATGASAFDNPEQRPLGERCILGFGQTAGPPAQPDYFYNNLHQIVQTPDSVMILTEMIHDVRVVRMNQPHLPPTIRKWLGDSVGRWEGETLVIDTTNFTDKTRYRGSSPDLHVVERFSRMDDKNLLYRFTVEDPRTWTKPWTGEYAWPATNDMIFEYACHEGNYALGDILRGARVLEKEAAEGRK